GVALGGRDHGRFAHRADRVVLGDRLTADVVQDRLVEAADLLGVQAVHLVPRGAAAATLQVDERVTGDLVLEPGAALAQDAPVPVQQDLGGDLDRLREGALDAGEPGGVRAVVERLVLQRALSALVADGAVQRVVHQQELDLSALGLLRYRRGVLGAHLHALGDLQRAGG